MINYDQNKSAEGRAQVVFCLQLFLECFALLFSIIVIIIIIVLQIKVAACAGRTISSELKRRETDWQQLLFRRQKSSNFVSPAVNFYYHHQELASAGDKLEGQLQSAGPLRPGAYRSWSADTLQMRRQPPPTHLSSPRPKTTRVKMTLIVLAVVVYNVNNQANQLSGTHFVLSTREFRRAIGALLAQSGRSKKGSAEK